MGHESGPHLPEDERIKLCCVSCEADDVIRYLEEELGVRVLNVGKDPILPPGLASHADLQVVPMPDGSVLVNERQQELISQLRNEHVDVTAVVGPERDYPGDCRLNSFFLNGSLIGNPKCVCKELTACAGSMISVKQGYAKCSTLLLSSDTVITDDPSIAKALGDRAILIRQKEITLKGYDRGFIGGASGKTGKNEVLFSGSLSLMTDGELVKGKLAETGIKFTELYTDRPPYDFGGIVIIR